MKMHIITAIFILLFSFTCYTQDVVTLKASLMPPCQLAINFYTDKMLALPMKASDNSKEENKRIDILRKDVRTLLLNDIKKTCQVQDSPKWYKDLLKTLLPIVVVALASRG